MKIGITGGSGFIGTHLSNKLRDKHLVTVFDIKKPSSDVWWCDVNILDLDNLIKSFEGLDVVYHLAGISDASYAKENPQETVKTNIKGTMNVVEACKENKIKRIIYASTDWVYNLSRTINPIYLESDELKLKPEHIYTVTKFLGEYMCKYSYIDYTILRFGSVYGYGSNFNVIPVFIQKALSNETFSIRGNGKQKRQYIYIDDLVNACIPSLNNKAINQVYNIVGSEFVSLNHVISLIQKYIPNFCFYYSKEREGEFTNKCVSSQKIIDQLQWKQETTLEEGIKKTIEIYQK